MSQEEICLERKICAVIHKQKDCKSCKQFYDSCEEWKQMEEVKDKIIEEIIKKIRSIR